MSEPGPIDDAALREAFAEAQAISAASVGFAAAQTLDRLLGTVARSHGAIELGMGEWLSWMGEGGRAMALGHAGIDDYAREELGISGRHAKVLASRARWLRDRPLLRAAVHDGSVDASHADAIRNVAHGEHEGRWVEMARTLTVRELRMAVRAAGGGADRTTAWRTIFAALTPDEAQLLKEVLGMAALVSDRGEATPQHERLEMMAMEYLGSHPPPAECGERRCDLASASEEVEPLPGEMLEIMNRAAERWERLSRMSPAGPWASTFSGDVIDGDRELKELARMRAGWDELLGHLCLLSRRSGAWRSSGLTRFEDYCDARLGMKIRAVQQRLRLQKQLEKLPATRQALQQGRLSLVKAQIVARHATEGNEGALVAEAATMTCIALLRMHEGRTEAQMFASGNWSVRIPEDIDGVFSDACEAARAQAGTPMMTVSACLVEIARHCREVWRPEATLRARAMGPIMRRDRQMCQVPRCSRAATDRHHIRFKSDGGDDSPENMVAVCRGHHLHGIHDGFVRVTGQAPDRLKWSFWAVEERARRARSTQVA